MRLADERPAERIERFARARNVSKIEPLVGDASNRSYYRVELQDRETRVLALLPAAFDPKELPFLNVAELLRAVPIRIPEVLEVFGAEGILLLEDLGDKLLQHEVEEMTGSRKGELYREAIEILARLQLRGVELESERYLPFRLAFDDAKFIQELEFFRQHFLEGFRGRSLAADEKDELDVSFRLIAAELCEQPFVLCHRDYHSRNLMLVSDEMVLIDFQDARRGPRAYDLVSLLNDSYVAHPPEFVFEMTEYYEHAVSATVSRDYDLAGLQRNLKALGTFGYQISRRENDVYRRYVDHTLALVRATLERNPRWDSLRRILARHCREIA